MENNDDYDVGYGKPPKHTQFQKGQSGNPKGRPKGTKNFKTDLMEELSEQVVITEGGKQSNISKQRAILKRTAQKALGGDMRAANMFVSWAIQLLGITSEAVDTEHISPADDDILKHYFSTVYMTTESDHSDGGGK